MNRSEADRTTAGTGLGRRSLLEVDGLSVAFPLGRSWQEVVHDVSFDAGAGEIVGLVGETGSGKTVTAQAVMGLTSARGGRITAGRVWFDGQELTHLPEHALRRLRGDRIAMIFQQPVRSINPAFTVGEQISETLRRHRGLSRREAWRRSVLMLERVHIPRADARAHDYPHTFSGGMCQRVMIAMALACEPRLLIADEPTTALDVTVQAKTLELLREIQADMGISILFISHDLAVIAELCDRVIVMYAGQIAEEASAEDLFSHPRHPYTEGLLGSIPKIDGSKRLRAIIGHVPVPGHEVTGCAFHPRCPYVEVGRCDVSAPRLSENASAPGRTVRCFRADELTLTGMPSR